MLGWGPRYIIDKIPSPVLRYHVGPSIRCISAATRVSRAAVAKQTSKKTKYEALPPDWQAVIGVEVHAQLKSRKKLFSSASSDEVEIQSSVDSENSLVAPFDVALPGSLPSLQKEPLQLALRACLALECEIADTMSFDRKHYFYPDLTSGYQITQKYAPLARNGKLRLLFDDGYLPSSSEEVTVGIEQVQLEQDTAKSTHYANHLESHTLIDLNRAGSALVEIVSGPDMRTAEQAGAYVRKLRETIRRIGVSDGNMDQGSLRCDVNVSINRKGEPWGTRCEVKNLNSIRFVMNAIGYEMGRQYKLLSSNQKVEQETRGYDESTGTTYTLRAKEDAPDYRYMPDPNLAQTYISPELLASAANEMPETIEQQRNRLTSQYKLPLNDVNILMRIDMEETRGNAHPVAYFEQLCQNRDPKVALNWIIQVLLRALNDQEKTFAENTISEEHFGQLIDLVEAGQVTASTARSLIKELLSNESLLQQESSQPNPVLSLLSSRDALALSGQDELTSLCQQIIKDLPKESDKVRQGNDKVVMRLVGEVMKRARGRADAQLARKIFTNLLRE